MEFIKRFVGVEQDVAGLVVELYMFQFMRAAWFLKLGGNKTILAAEEIWMHRLVFHKYAFLQIEKRCFRFVFIFKTEAEKRSEMKCEKQGVIGHHTRAGLVKVNESILDKMK